MAYADDLCIVDHSKEGIEDANWAHLKFNTTKCALINSKSRKYMENFSPTLQGDPLNGKNGINTWVLERSCAIKGGDGHCYKIDCQ